jgi:hypothetical protein
MSSRKCYPRLASAIRSYWSSIPSCSRVDRSKKEGPRSKALWEGAAMIGPTVESFVGLPRRYTSAEVKLCGSRSPWQAAALRLRG